MTIGVNEVQRKLRIGVTGKEQEFIEKKEDECVEFCQKLRGLKWDFSLDWVKSKIIILGVTKD